MLTTRITNMYYYNEAQVKEIALQVQQGNFSWYLNHNDALWKQLEQWEDEYCDYNTKHYTKTVLPSGQVVGYGTGSQIAADSIVNAESLLNTKIPRLEKGGIAWWPHPDNQNQLAWFQGTAFLFNDLQACDAHGGLTCTDLGQAHGAIWVVPAAEEEAEVEAFLQ